MDFEDSSQEAQFRREVRGWLAENAAQYRQRFPAGIGVEEFMTHARAWQRRKSFAWGGFPAARAAEALAAARP